MSPLASPVHRVRAPGVEFKRIAPDARLSAVRLDECGFVGVAPRGPAFVPWLEPGREPLNATEWLAAARRRSVPVAVNGWDDYLQTFGGFEGPGLLPHAVAAFFAQGGRRAHVVRVVPTSRLDALNRSGVATGSFDPNKIHLDGGGEVTLNARNPGSWGNRLRAELTATLAPLPLDHDRTTVSELWLATDHRVTVGCTIRLRLADGTSVLRRVDELESRPQPPARRFRVPVATLSTPVLSKPVRAERIRFDIAVTEIDDDGRPIVSPADRRERHLDVALDPRHPRWLAWVLANESQLVEPVADWANTALALPKTLTPVVTNAFDGGLDRYSEIVFDDVIGDDFTVGDEPPYSGAHALAEVAQLGMITVPDLHSPGLPALKKVDPVISVATDHFEPCVEVMQPAMRVIDEALPGLQLDPRDPKQLQHLIGLQDRLVTLGDMVRCATVLLDVPSGLSLHRLRGWRARFATAFAAAYHPWLLVSRQDDARTSLVSIPPSAVAAGIIARRELAGRVAAGPANELARDVLDVTTRVSDVLHAELHSLGVNVFVAERDGIRLTAARTLSIEPEWRQLSVRRLVTAIELALRTGLAWAVFEPNGAALWSAVRHVVGTYLRTIWLAGGLAGASESEAFFVRCDCSTMTRNDLDNGRLVALVGLAPAEPLEFIVVELRCDDTGLATGVGRA